MKADKKPEVTFEEKAAKYAACAISSLREMVEAMEHAAECNGDCEDCNGSGKQTCEECQGTELIASNDEHGKPGELPCTYCEHGERDCVTCEGSGKCAEGKDSDAPDCWHDEDSARQRIEEDALSVEVRSDWHTPGDEDAEATDYNILITTGGPAARIVGELDQYKQPRTAVFEYQDWFKPWTEVYSDSADTAVMLKYAQQFYFGE